MKISNLTYVVSYTHSPHTLRSKTLQIIKKGLLTPISQRLSLKQIKISKPTLCPCSHILTQRYAFNQQAYISINIVCIFLYYLNRSDLIIYPSNFNNNQRRQIKTAQKLRRILTSIHIQPYLMSCYIVLFS
jgi:hypothetical protein